VFGKFRISNPKNPKTLLQPQKFILAFETLSFVISQQKEIAPTKRNCTNS
jgi:hypothetical protein